MTAVRETSGLSAIGDVTIREVARLSAIAAIKGRDASNALVTLFSSFSNAGLSVSPGTASGFTSSHGLQRINTNSVTVSIKPAGAVDGVAWSIDAGGWDALAPTSLTTAFRSPSCGPGDQFDTTATCTVTRGAAVATIDVPLSVSNLGS